jgi:GTP cyclohydrolase FolE2
VDWLDLLQKLIIAGLATYTGVKARKEWRVGRRLGKNPARCEDMARRMKDVEADIKLMRGDIKYIMDRME